MLDERFVIVGALIGMIGAISYIVDTIKGKTKPNRVTWFLWALAPLLAFYAQLQQGVGLRALMTFVVGFNPACILVASFLNKKSQWKITKLDIACGILSIAGLILWQLTQVGNLAILFSIMADGIAAIPTLAKSFKFPDTENYKAFFFGMINSAITLATIKIWRFEYFAFPIYIFLTCFILVLLIKFRLGLKLQKTLAK